MQEGGLDDELSQFLGANPHTDTSISLDFAGSSWLSAKAFLVVVRNGYSRQFFCELSVLAVGCSVGFPALLLALGYYCS
jgi:hypothetical protein